MPRMDDISPTILDREWNGHHVHAFLIDNTWWILAADICKVIGIQNPARAVQRVQDHEKRPLPPEFAQVSASIRSAYAPPRGESNTPWLVTQQGAQKILITSRRAGATKLLNWIVYELIPAAQEGRVARMPSSEDHVVAVQRDTLAEVEYHYALLGKVVANLRESSAELIRLHERADEHEAKLVRLDDEVVGIKDDLWARKSEIPRKTCRGWANKAKREGRLLVEPDEKNLLRLGRRVGKLCRARGIEKHYVDDDRNDEVGKWPVGTLEEAAAELGYVGQALF